MIESVTNDGPHFESSCLSFLGRLVKGHFVFYDPLRFKNGCLSFVGRLVKGHFYNRLQL